MMKEKKRLRCETRATIVRLISVPIILGIIFIPLIAQKFTKPPYSLFAMLLLMFPLAYDGHDEEPLTGVCGFLALHDYTVCVRCFRTFIWYHAPFDDWRKELSPSETAELLKQLEVDCDSFKREMEEAEHVAVREGKRRLLKTLQRRMSYVKLREENP